MLREYREDLIQKYRLLVLIVFILFMTLSSSCSNENDKKIVDLSKRAPVISKADEEGKRSIRIAVGGMITPKEGFTYYKRFLDYIGEKTGMNVIFVDRENYGEINDLLERNQIDVAFVCGGPYVDGHSKFGMQLLAAPMAYGDTVYYSYILAPAGSDINDLNDLRGKSFAFTDPLSNTGKLVPTFMLAKLGETPDSFFKKYFYTYAHDKSIKAVALGVVDGAAVDSLVWEYANKTDPKFTSRTKIIWRSPPYGIPPVVTRKGLDKEIRDKIEDVFLSAHEDLKGREILSGMMIERFVEVSDGSYDSIREMKTWIKKHQKD
ncbi:MAG: phosphate/phosphite/phosphonate ABC transporter substrate-binding protein [Nitrospirota bacterium]|nr:MAG: phosphate/phosphite/phosphonate ABC transporter substrate-binding protein [Nitrospirota bacterium]